MEGPGFNCQFIGDMQDRKHVKRIKEYNQVQNVGDFIGTRHPVS